MSALSNQLSNNFNHPHQSNYSCHQVLTFEQSNPLTLYCQDCGLTNEQLDNDCQVALQKQLSPTANFHNFICIKNPFTFLQTETLIVCQNCQEVQTDTLNITCENQISIELQQELEEILQEQIEEEEQNAENPEPAIEIPNQAQPQPDLIDLTFQNLPPNQKDKLRENIKNILIDQGLILLISAAVGIMLPFTLGMPFLLKFVLHRKVYSKAARRIRNSERIRQIRERGGKASKAVGHAVRDVGTKIEKKGKSVKNRLRDRRSQYQRNAENFQCVLF